MFPLAPYFPQFHLTTVWTFGNVEKQLESLRSFWSGRHFGRQHASSSASTFRKLFSTLTSPFFSEFEDKVCDISSTYSQPWPFSTLPQTFVTSLIILSLQLSRRGFWNWCPPANLTQDLIALYTAPSSNPCVSVIVFFFSCTAMFYGCFGSPNSLFLLVIWSRIFQ